MPTSTEEIEKLECLKNAILRLCHCVQTGIAAKMNMGDVKDTEPKHLRTGLNVAMCDHGALVALLIKKGIITELEYAESTHEMLKKEVAMYEDELSIRVGKKVTII